MPLSGWIQGPAAATYAGVLETDSAGMSTNGDEQRFWLYFDTTNQYRTLDDFGSATADRALFVQFSNNGQIYVRTDRPGNPNGYTTAAYTSVGAYTTGWTEFRIVYTFTDTGAQTYTLSKRATPPNSWTPLKAAAATGYAIPFRGVNTISTTHGLLFRAYQNANLWLDDFRYDDGGIADE